MICFVIFVVCSEVSRNVEGLVRKEFILEGRVKEVYKKEFLR